MWELKLRWNFGRYIFDQTMKHAKTDVVKFSIAFPTLLCSIMLEQHPGFISAADLPKKRESPLTIDHKLFGDNHVPDLVGTSGSTLSAGSMTKEQIITALKDTCVMLDERKTRFELMIHALEREDDANEGEDVESKEEEDAGNTHEDEGSEEDSDSRSEAE